jgi:hypothetical protein
MPESTTIHVGKLMFIAIRWLSDKYKPTSSVKISVYRAHPSEKPEFHIYFVTGCDITNSRLAAICKWLTFIKTDLYQDSQRLKDAILDDNLAYLTFNLFELFTGLFFIKTAFWLRTKNTFHKAASLSINKLC